MPLLFCGGDDLRAGGDPTSRVGGSWLAKTARARCVDRLVTGTSERRDGLGGRQILSARFVDVIARAVYFTRNSHPSATLYMHPKRQAAKNSVSPSANTGEKNL